ncbi:MAG: DUF2975 domain-containing protein [Flavobacteriaceae bacterium]
MNTKQVLSVMKVVSWVIFIGLCINTGAIIISFLVSLFVNPEAASDLYINLNMSKLYEYNLWYYISMMSLIIALLALKAYIFFLVIKIFSKIHVNNPFSSNVAALVYKISYVALSIGVMSIIASSYKMWLVKKDFITPISFGSQEFLFMAGILFVVAFIFKRGVEIQNENELTI